MQGYAKSGRHDLKQMVLLLATTGAARFPIWMEAHSGNASDKKSLPAAAQKMQALCKGLIEAPEFIYVGGSAIYANILEQSHHMQWITRVPENIKQAKQLASLSIHQDAFITLENGYSYYATTSDYGGIKQRWILLYSEAAYQREIKTLEKKIKKISAEEYKTCWHFSNRGFKCQADTQLALKELIKSLKYNQVDAKVVAIKKYKGFGRRKNSELPELIGYQIQYTLSLME